MTKWRWMLLCGLVVCVAAGPGAASAYAQGSGVLIGFASSAVDIGTLPALYTQTRFSGWTGGGFLGLGPDRINVSIEGVFALKGSRFGKPDPAAGPAGSLSVNQLVYLDVPVLVHVRVGTIARRPLAILAGPSFNVLLRARDINHSTNLKPLMKTLDRAIVVGADMDLGGSFLQIRYEWSLQNLAVNGGLVGTGTTKINSFSLIVGARF